MTCSIVNIGGATAIICGKIKIHTCIKCRAIATRQCDWKIGGGKTCDAYLCDACTHSPASEKDLCPAHASEWIARQQDMFARQHT